mgnify:CR=1 FL=1
MNGDSESLAPELESVRLDIWLWAVRIFKTRSLAAQACRKGNVSIRDNVVKASRQVREGDVIAIQKRFFTQTVKVVGLLERRVGAKLVPDSCEDLTPEEEYQSARERARAIMKAPQREAGAGRPTKKDRRELDEIEAAEDRTTREALFEKWIRSSGL